MESLGRPQLRIDWWVYVIFSLKIAVGFSDK